MQQQRVNGQAFPSGRAEAVICARRAFDFTRLLTTLRVCSRLTAAWSRSMQSGVHDTVQGL